MAPADASKKRGREANFLDLGVVGRRTGVTLKDTGIRDDDGLEPMEGIFSSPEKSPEKPPTRSNGAAKNSTINTEEEMDIGNSTAPEPTDVLTERRRTIAPPPRSRSPIKTFLGSPAKRGSSMGPISSPFRKINEGKSDGARPAVNRRLDFSAIDKAPLTARPRQWEASNQPLPVESNSRANTSHVSDIGDELGSIQQSGDEGTHSRQDDEDAAGGDLDDFSLLVQQDDDTVDLVVQNTTQPQQNLVLSSSPTPVPKRARGRPRKGEPKAPTPVSAPKGRVRAAKNISQFIKEEASDHEDERPLKRRRNASTGLSAAKKQVKKKPPPSQRDPNARVTSGKRASEASLAATMSRKRNREPQPGPGPEPEPELELEEETEAEAEPKKRRPPREPQNPALKPRSLYITRRETPMDDGALRTRSGRTSVKPCAYWRNERIVYGEGDRREGEGYLLPTIKEVIRTEEVTPPRRKRRGPATGAGRKKRARTEETESEDDEEPWEIEPGIMIGDVDHWDEEMEKTSDLEPIQSEIAYSSNAIETIPVPNSTFRYSKIISLDFYGAGMVDIPPAGQKRTKNSRKMQMSFFVHYGRVLVEVAGTQFRIGKGGMWQVPRGNFYSITNDYNKPARIFFSQGCVSAD
ncbi:MAG: hypothetical protein M1840_000185 [Geoglossum simile]|nr:MAG: hypothetical protein M1840_000185 [Geoglossum simile]